MGGRISNKFKEYQKISMLSPEYVLPYMILDNYDRLMQIKDLTERAKEIIKLIGEADLMNYITELTRLSMILAEAPEEAEDVSDWLKPK